MRLHAVGAPPRVMDDVVEKRKIYDLSTSNGRAATDLLSKWHDYKSDRCKAPWRQTVEHGQFGDVQWIITLRSAFDAPGGDCPEFHLWQLALADYTVCAFSMCLSH